MFMPQPLSNRLELTRSVSFDSYFLKQRIDKTDRRLYHFEKERGLPQACLFVASLHAQKSKHHLQKSVLRAFEKFGPLLNVTVNRDQKQRPFAFVQFKYVRDAEKAQSEGQNMMIDQRLVRIETAKVNRTLFISRIQDVPQEQFWEMASSVGPIEELDYRKENHEAFIKFMYREDALRACSWYKQFGWSSQWINQPHSFSLTISNIHSKANEELYQELKRYH
jgi:hypothetical protein